MHFIEKYLEEVQEIAKLISAEKIDQILQELINLKNRNGRIFILGIGGSAGNASHAVNDFRKLTSIEAYAPTDNISELTARANDEGWDTIFAEYLKISKLNPKDCILVLSVGGGDIERNVSANICKAIDFAKTKSAKILAIVGREAGYAASNSDVCLVVPSVNPNHVTPHSEAMQTVIWHLLVTHPKLKSNSTKW